MINPYQTTHNRITKENSLFNTLPKSYEFHTLKNLYFIYEIQILLNTEIPTKDIYKSITK